MGNEELMALGRAETAERKQRCDRKGV